MRLSIALLKGAGPRAAACRRSLRTLEGFACGLPCTSSGGLSRRGHTRNTGSIPHVASPLALGGGTSSHGHMGNGECAGQRPVSLHTLSFYMRPSLRTRGWHVLARPHVETPSRGRLGPHIRRGATSSFHVWPSHPQSGRKVPRAATRGRALRTSLVLSRAAFRRAGQHAAARERPLCARPRTGPRADKGPTSGPFPGVRRRLC